jgi:hypothetical protein
MPQHPEHVALLTSAPTEMHAGIIVAALEENGVKSTTSGEATAGMRAEAPGWVQILVTEEDLPRAQAVLQEVLRESSDIDWSQIDVGQPEDE